MQHLLLLLVLLGTSMLIGDGVLTCSIEGQPALAESYFYSHALFKLDIKSSGSRIAKCRLAAYVMHTIFFIIFVPALSLKRSRAQLL